METRNRTITSEFVLLGFSKDLKINIALFFLFFVIYLVTFIGNCLILFTVIFTHLHTPMYFFLCNIAFLDLCFSTNALPKMLIDFFSSQRTISFTACALQLHACLFLGTTEYILLSAMAYDRYVAICHPLHYTVLMSMKTCCRIVVFKWILSFFLSVIPSLMMPISLCFPNLVDHFMCEVLAVLKLACGDIHQTDLVLFSVSFISLLFPFTLILVSYACIISSIIRIRSVDKVKIFSTCSSHIVVVALCFGPAMTLYFGSSSRRSSNQEKYISVFYVAITPMLNPLVYSLRNRKLKENLKQVITKMRTL